MSEEATNTALAQTSGQRLRLHNILTLIITVAVALAIGCGIGWLLEGLIQSGLLGPSVWLVLPILVLIVLILALATHQGGHLLAGRLRGFQPRLFVLGPLRLQSGSRKPHITFNHSLALYPGAAAAATTNQISLRMRTFMLVLGGPLANLLLGLLALGLFVVLGYHLSDPPPATLAAALLSTLLLLLALFSLGIGLFTLVPIRANDIFTDGAQLLLLTGETTQAERWSALSCLQNAALAGTRPRDWDSLLLLQAVSLSDNTLDDLTGCLYIYFQYLDRDDHLAAQPYLQRMVTGLEKLPEDLRSIFLLEAAYYTARYYHNAPKARAWLRRCPERATGVEPGSRARVEAALLLSEKRLPEAQACAQNGLTALRSSPYPGIATMEADWLHTIQQEADAT